MTRAEELAERQMIRDEWQRSYDLCWREKARYFVQMQAARADAEALAEALEKIADYRKHIGLLDDDCAECAKVARAALASYRGEK